MTIEVKYIDTFSAAKLKPSSYRHHLDALGLDEQATERIVAKGGSQFLRSVMLTDSVRRGGLTGDGTGIEHAAAVVLARADDRSAQRVTEAVGEHDLAARTGLWSHETFFDAAARQPALRNWAERMRERYVSP